MRLVQHLAIAYAVIAFGTLAALVAMSSLAPDLATPEAWGHAVIVAALALLLPLRVRAARRGRDSGLRAVLVIGCVLAVVNLVEAALVGVFPGWMRVQMLVVAALALALAGAASRARRRRRSAVEVGAR
ncbi:hypothetical protein ABT337_08230 [Saccharopolyspora hirsuta]|uniref:hypothetical protein n=1 Tax=Saccharopolyspora hirsuta TaxID=1837 RepID=UPI00332AC4FE